VWVAADADTRLYIDLDGDPATGPLTDSFGSKYDFHCDVDAYESWTVYDDGTTGCYTPSQDAANGGDKDLTGAKVYSLDGARLSAAWGQRPNYNAGLPALDMGTTILPFPEIILRKSSVLSNDVDGDGVADAGDEIEYTLEMENLGVVNVNDVLINDETPYPTSYIANSTTLDNVAQADNTNPNTISPLDADSPGGGLFVGTIAPGTTRTIVFRVVVDTPIPFGVAEVVNHAIMTSDVGTTSATNKRPLDVPFPLQILKTSSPSSSPVSSGDTITYTVQVFNAALTDQTLVEVNDVLPPGTTYVPGSVAGDIDGTPTTVAAPPDLATGVTLPGRLILTVTFDVTVDAPMAAGTTDFTNTAETFSNEAPTPIYDTAIDPAGPEVDLSLTKIDDESAPLSPGDRLVYTIQVENKGPDIADDVIVVDTLPSEVTYVDAASDPTCAEGPTGTVTCSLGDLGVTTTSIDIAVDIKSGVDGTINNTATVSSSTPEGNPGDETDDEDTDVDSPPTLTVDKTALPTSIDEPGGTVTFSVVVTNTSVEPVTVISLTDDVFGNLLDPANPNVSANDCPAQSTSLAVGAALSCSFDGAVVGTFGGAAHVDTVTAVIEDDEANSANAQDQASVTFTDALPTVGITKTPSPSSVAEPGGVVTFSVVVTNTSVEPVTVTSLTDDIFGNLLDPANPNVTANDCPAQGLFLTVAGSLSCSFDAFVAGDFGDPNHVDTVTVVVEDNETNSANAADQASVSFTDAAPSVTVTKTASPGSVSEPGATVTFSVTVQNTSAEPVTVTSLTDDIFGNLLDPANPSVTSNGCPAQSTSLGVGGTLSCSFDAFVSGDYGDPDHQNTVTGVVEDDDTNTANDSDDATVVFADVLPSISVSKTPAPGAVSEPGGTVTFSVVVTNTSVEPVTITSLTDDVFGNLLDPANPSVSANDCPAQSTALGLGGTLSCSFDAFVAGDAGDPDHVNRVTAFAQDDDANSVSEFDDASVTFNDELPTVSVSKTATPGSVSEPGATVTFSVVVTNTSVEPVSVTSLTDSVFGNLLDPANPSVSANDCPAQSTALGVGGTLSCSFDGFVAGDAGDPDHLNTVTAVVEDDDGNSANGNDSATVNFLDVLPSVGVTKTPSIASVFEPGATVRFDVTVTNTSVETVTVNSLIDDVYGDLLDAGNTAVSGNSCLALPATMVSSGVFACSFRAPVTGNYGDPDHENTVTFTVSDDEGNVANDDDTATVAFNDVIPMALVTKTPSTGTVQEPGGSVVFVVDIINTVGEVLSLDALTDDVFGDLLDPANPNITANSCSAISSIAPNSTVMCSFTAALSGVFGDPDHHNTVTATLSDDDGNSVTPSDDAVVVYTSAGSTVSGFVFEDLDLDGVFNGVDQPFADIDIIVVDSGGSPTTVTTAANGSWSASVLPGPVTISVDPASVPAGYTLTTGNDTQVLAAVASTDVAAYDIGYGPPIGAISGTIFLDLDGDPDRDAGEPGFVGIPVELLDSLGGTVASTTSIADGFYSFTDLGPGTYTVVVDGVAVGTGYVGSIDPDGTVDDTTDVPVAAGETVTGVDFGYRGTASIGDTVWIDENEDGVIDIDEPVLPDADVTVTWAGFDGVLGTSDDFVFPTQTTDSNGEYLFDNLPPGLYEAAVTTDDVAIDVSPTTNTEVEITLGVGEIYVLADFGFALDGELPLTGLEAEHLMLAAALLMGLSGLVLADGRKRERRFDLALGRIDEE
jgi:uncharacterized repeat protein (TIGR01451 family)